MTREEVKKIFLNASDEEITALLNQHNTEIKAAKSSGVKEDELKSLREKAQKFDDYEKEKLSAEEKLQRTLEEAEKAKTDNLKLLNKTKAIAEFTASGLTEKEYGGFIDSIVTDNEENTLNSAKSIAAMLKNQKETWEKDFREKEISNTPHPNQSSGGDDSDGLSSAEKLAKSLAEKNAAASKISDEQLKNLIGG